MDLIITGASGILGYEFINQILNNPSIRYIYALSRQSRKNEGKIRWMTNQEFLNCSSLNLQPESSFLHLAFARSSEAIDIEESLDFFYKAIKKSHKLGIQHYINLSSQSIYNPERVSPAKEEDIPMPTNLYAVGKLYSEKWLEKYAEKNHLLVLQIRLASLIGLGLEKRIPSRLLKEALKNKKLSITSGEEVFSFLLVEDAAKALCNVIAREKMSGIYNLGTKEKYSILDIATTIQDLLVEAGLGRIEILNSPKAPPYPNNSLNVEKFEEEFQWEAKRTLKDQLQKDLFVFFKHGHDINI